MDAFTMGLLAIFVPLVLLVTGSCLWVFSRHQKAVEIASAALAFLLVARSVWVLRMVHELQPGHVGVAGGLMAFSYSVLAVLTYLFILVLRFFRSINQPAPQPNMMPDRPALCATCGKYSEAIASSGFCALCGAANFQGGY
jgi:hypothetical protein